MGSSLCPHHTQTSLHTCQLSWIIQESPRYSADLPLSCMGHHISRTKSSFELSCALVWDLAHFKLKTSIFQFLGHFCMYLVIDKDYFWHQNDDCEIWYKTSYNVLSHSHWGQHQFVGGGGGLLKFPGGVKKGESPEVGISVIVNFRDFEEPYLC